MHIKNILCTTISERRLISFEYDNKPIRRAAPHAVYYSTTGHLNLDAFQYDGYSKTGKLPVWRNFTLDKMRHLELLDEKFEKAPGYKPHSKKYDRAICKI